MACSVTTCRDGQGDCKSNRECPGDLMCSDAGIIPKGYTFKDKEDWSSWFRFCYSTNRGTKGYNSILFIWLIKKINR